jgi:hypothetical protein
MVDAFNEEGNVNKKNLETAKLIRDSGQLLTATEISATNRYWHVWSSDTHNNTYPKEYAQPVVGMLYDTMASFQTWYVKKSLVCIASFSCSPLADHFYGNRFLFICLYRVVTVRVLSPPPPPDTICTYPFSLFLSSSVIFIIHLQFQVLIMAGRIDGYPINTINTCC